LDSGIEEDIISEVAKNKEFLIDVTRELIRLPTVNPPKKPKEEWKRFSDYGAAARYLRQQIRKIGITHVEVKNTPIRVVREHYKDTETLHRPNVLCSLGDSEATGVHLNGHYDTVPTDPTRWRITRPFKPVVRGNRIYGLGASDMKAGVASILCVLKVLRNLGVPIRKSVSASFTCDEETGGQAGVGYLACARMIGADYAVIAEPAQPHMVKHGIKGRLWLKITTKGKEAHASQPHLGINAFEKLVDATLAIRELARKELSRVKTKYNAEDKPSACTTVALGGEVNGGTKVSTVPGSCTMSLDCRFIPEFRSREVERKIRRCLEALEQSDPSFDFEMDTDSVDEPVVFRSDSKVFSVLKDAHARIFKTPPNLVISSGANDSVFLARRRIPTAVYGPGLSEQAHRVDEFVKVNDLVRTTQVLALAVYSLTQEKSSN